MKYATILASTLALVTALPEAKPRCPPPKNLLPWIQKNGTNEECMKLESTKPSFKVLEEKCGTTWSCNVLSNFNEKWLIEESGFADDEACLARHERDPDRMIRWYPKSLTDDECLELQKCKPTFDDLDQQCGTEWTCGLLDNAQDRLEITWLGKDYEFPTERDCLRKHMPGPFS
ncbi:hypothetical protein J3459_006007 [Metarhizium acridum]|nr:hypothetical protein J3459_006007 [Metarhizium acridum]